MKANYTRKLTRVSIQFSYLLGGCQLEPLKQELDRLSNIGMIQKVDTPTEWISAVVVTTKKNGKVRLCIDPKPLNEALRRNHYPLPTIDDVLPLLSKARVFTVLDAKNGF